MGWGGVRRALGGGWSGDRNLGGGGGVVVWRGGKGHSRLATFIPRIYNQVDVLHTGIVLDECRFGVTGSAAL